KSMSPILQGDFQNIKNKPLASRSALILLGKRTLRKSGKKNNPTKSDSFPVNQL
ncbi:MAG: hypothetical protein ACI9AB_002366, partial [Urechidicola sp.]